MKSLYLLLVVLPVLFVSCGSSYLNLIKISDEAKPLYEETLKIFKSSMDQTKGISLLAVEEALKLPVEWQTQKFVAHTAAKLLTEEAIRVIFKNQANKIDKIFDVDLYNALTSMMINTYCIPALNEINESYINNYINEKLYAVDTSLVNGNLSTNVDSIIAIHCDRLNLEDIINFIKGIVIHNELPSYVDSLNSLSILPVNSSDYAVTKNWKDQGLIYQYRIHKGNIEMRRGNDPWAPLPLPRRQKPRSIAADNNRLFVLTKENELWWYCAKEDQSQWSIDIIKAAIEVANLKQIDKQDLCELIISCLVKVTDDIACLVADDPLFKGWQGPCKDNSESFWQMRCKLWTDIVWSTDKHILETASRSSNKPKNGYFRWLKADYHKLFFPTLRGAKNNKLSTEEKNINKGSSFTASDYLRWFNEAHQEGAWTNLLEWSIHDNSFTRGKNIKCDEIQDIAVGNWNGTTATMYAIAKGEIWYLSEEIIHNEWKPIRQWTSEWLTKKNYHDIKRSPYPLNPNSKINASNSVIAVSKPSHNGLELHWIRWDHHQMDDFFYWPIDWCEHTWNKIYCPVSNSTEFRINTLGFIDPREDSTVWSAPFKAYKFRSYPEAGGYRNIFGDVQQDSISTYPIELIVTGDSGDIYRFYKSQSMYVTDNGIKWERF